MKMTIKPILFNTEMVRAILEGRKSCTRRLVKFLSGENPQWTGYIRDGLMLYNGRNEPCIMKAPYQPGDILYVRETWHRYTKRVGEGGKFHLEERYGYKASIENSEDADEPWHPSIHMPKEAARIWLKVTNVRVERLQHMTDDDAEAEGCFDYTSTALGFPDVWDSTIKKFDLDRYGWAANPWVWVIEFERCEKPKEEN